MLLEVLIAFFLVALCALPLVQPQVAMLKAQRAFINDVELDRIVDRLYASLLVLFYKEADEVKWVNIGSKEFPKPPIPIVDGDLQKMGYTGTYTIRLAPTKNHREYSKDKDDKGVAHANLLEIQYTFTSPGETPSVYTFLLYVKSPRPTKEDANATSASTPPPK